VGIVGSFLIVVGVPFAIAAGLGTVRMTRLARTSLIAGPPVALLAYVYGTPHSLDEIGLGVIALLAIVGWLSGALAAQMIRGRWRSVSRDATPS